MHVTRQRLISELDAPGHLVIWASPGSGKSTLLQQWADDATGRGVRVTPVDGRAATATAFAPAVLAAAEVVMLDNADALAAPARAAVQRLLEDEAAPRLIVAGRSDPFPVSPARWMTTRELRTADLAFTPLETRQLLDRRGITLDPATVAMLLARTAGWATGLALASHLLASRPDAEQVARDFGGDHRAIGDYLLGEVLGTLTATERDVLVRCAVRERVAPDLAAAVSGDTQAGALLAGIARRNLLLDTGTDGEVVYHPVLLAYLAAEARQSGDDHRRTHAVAARWFLAGGDATEALAHAVAAGDPETAAAVLRVHGVALTCRGSAGLRAAVRVAATAEPQLAALYARMAEAPYLSRSGAEAPLEQFDTGSAARGVVASALAALWDADGGDADLGEPPATAGVSDEEAAALAFAGVVRARIALQTESGPARGAALDRLRQLAETAGDRGHDWLRAVALESIVSCSLGTPGWRDAEDVIRAALERPLAVESLSSTAGSRLLLLEVDLSYLRAEELPERAMRVLLSEDFGDRQPDIQRRANAVALLDRLAAEPSRDTLHRFDTLAADAGNDPAFLAFALVPWLSAVAHHDDHPARDSLGWRVRQVFGADAVESLLVHFLTDPCRDTEHTLRAAIASGAPTWDPLTVAHARLRLAMHAHNRGASAKARTDLAEAVMLADHYRAVRPFLLFGGDALALLAADGAHLGAWSGAAANLLAAARRPDSAPAIGVTSLTPRERSLLDELPVHQTIADIAKRQQVSANTVKSQLKSVYRKLGVDNRADAVAVGRTAGLIG